MTENLELRVPANEAAAPSWGTQMDVWVCENCDWRFLLPTDSSAQTCPHCYQIELSLVANPAEVLDENMPPERVIPFQISSQQLFQAIESFGTGIPFAPADLNPANLSNRIRQIYLPMWLVDIDVQASWQAEAGFEYEVVSHQDRYDGVGWDSQQVKEVRTRWEPRLGNLQRSYANQAAPATQDAPRLKGALGDFDLGASEAYDPEKIASGLVRLPDRTTQDAWNEAALAVQRSAAEECRLACRADHIRQFQWKAEYPAQNWTLCLLPVISTYYVDDAQARQPVLIHGRTGKIHGVRRASQQRAQKLSVILLLIALGIFALSLVLLALGVAAPFLFPAGIIGMFAALLTGLGAIGPIAAAAWFNRQQAQTQKPTLF